MRSALKTLIVILAAIALPAAASAQQYQPWNNPDSGGGDRLQGFAERLNKLIDEAERSRAADLGFLRDLRGLAGEYRRMPRTLLLSDDFADGDYTRDPRWTVTAGRYWVERGWGLRSAIKPGQTPAQTQQKRLSRKEKTISLFGQILQQAIDPEGRQGGMLGGGIELFRVTGQGSAVIASAPGPLNLEDKKTHRLEWTRGTDGSMIVSIDAKQVLAATDLGFRQDFDGLRMVNRGGDYIFKRFAVYGTR